MIYSLLRSVNVHNNITLLRCSFLVLLASFAVIVKVCPRPRKRSFVVVFLNELA